jgi:hypothetical protein
MTYKTDKNMKKLFSFYLCLFCSILIQSKPAENFRMILHDDWRMQSSLTNKATGTSIKKRFPGQ